MATVCVDDSILQADSWIKFGFGWLNQNVSTHLALSYIHQMNSHDNSVMTIAPLMLQLSHIAAPTINC